MSLTKEVVSVTKIGELDYVPEDNTFYTVRLQLGCKRRWREFGGGRWEKDPERRDPLKPGTMAMRHIPEVHIVRNIPAQVLNGLIAEHNLFLSDRSQQISPRNDIGYMLVVTGFERSESPANRAVVMPPGFEQMVAEIVAKTVKATLASVGGD